MAKYSDVSLALRNKIRRDMVLFNDVYGDGLKGCLTLTHHDTPLIQECLLWHEVIMSYFKTSYDAYKMTKIGRFYGVRPKLIRDMVADSEGTLNVVVEFEVDDYDEESWLDWFDVKGEADGKLQGSLGHVINKRTFPQYYDEDGKYIFDKE